MNNGMSMFKTLLEACGYHVRDGDIKIKEEEKISPDNKFHYDIKEEKIINKKVKLIRYIKAR